MMAAVDLGSLLGIDIVATLEMWWDGLNRLISAVERLAEAVEKLTPSG